jgi:hypothetical protein
MSFVIRPLSSFPSRSSLLVRPTSTRAFSVTPARALSKITLVGRLAGEPELSPTSTGQEIVKYTVATNYGPKDERKTSWWRISYFPREGNNAGRDHVLSLGKGCFFFFFFFSVPLCFSFMLLVEVLFIFFGGEGEEDWKEKDSRLRSAKNVKVKIKC